MNNNRTLSNVKRIKGNYFFEDDIILDGNISVKSSSRGDTLVITPSSILYNSNLTIATQTSGTTQANISALETKTQNMTSVVNSTTLTGDLTVGNNVQCERMLPRFYGYYFTLIDFAVGKRLLGGENYIKLVNMGPQEQLLRGGSVNTSSPVQQQGYYVDRAGYYKVSITVRVKDTSGVIGIQPIVNTIRTFDTDTFFFGNDGQNRRCLSFSHIVALNTGHNVGFLTSGICDVVYCCFMVEYLGRL